ncbi:MAG: hypothetical protein WC710_14185 [Gallionella sp.]|jgi:hypothetical protein
MNDNDKLSTALELASAALLAVAEAVKAEQAAPVAPEPAPKFSVGQQVRVTSKSGVIRHFLDLGAVGKITEYDAEDNTYCIESGRYHQWLSSSQFEAYTAPEPAMPSLRYKVGDYVLVPCKVVSADTSTLPYEIAPIGEPNTKKWMPRAALEPAAPKVGDRCLFWDNDISDACEGELAEDDGPYDQPRYRRDNDDYHYNCAKL